MLKVLSHNTVKILRSRTNARHHQQLRDVLKCSCNFTTKSNSSSGGPIPTPKSYTFQQKQQNNNNTTAYGWIMLAIPLTTFGLGCWQVQRKQWKERLIDELHVQTNSLPVDLPEE